jgi:hypothetical protein
MKKLLTITLLTLGLSSGVAFGANPTLNYFNTTTEDLLGHLEKFYNDKNISDNIRSEILSKVVKEANRQLTELNTRTTTSVNNGAYNSIANKCLQKKISQTLWEGVFNEQGRNRQILVSDIANLQLYLDNNGYFGQKPAIGFNYEAGSYQTSTAEAIKRFQYNNGIVQTGTVGPKTLAKLNSLVCGGGLVTQQLPVSCVQAQGSEAEKAKPVITSLSSYIWRIGSEIEIRGCNFYGFESDRTIKLTNSAGQEVSLYHLGGPSGTFRVKLNDKICLQDNSYSGLPCQNYLDITPGKYKIYAVSWGGKSNVVEIEIKPLTDL